MPVIALEIRGYLRIVKEYTEKPEDATRNVGQKTSGIEIRLKS